MTVVGAVISHDLWAYAGMLAVAELLLNGILYVVDRWAKRHSPTAVVLTLPFAFLGLCLVVALPAASEGVTDLGMRVALGLYLVTAYAWLLPPRLRVVRAQWRGWRRE